MIFYLIIAILLSCNHIISENTNFLQNIFCMNCRKLLEKVRHDPAFDICKLSRKEIFYRDIINIDYIFCSRINQCELMCGKKRYY